MNGNSSPTPTPVEWRVVVLPDDPRLEVTASRRRAFRTSKAWKRQRFTPRSVSKNHETHLLTAAEGVRS